MICNFYNRVNFEDAVVNARLDKLLAEIDSAYKATSQLEAQVQEESAKLRENVEVLKRISSKERSKQINMAEETMHDKKMEWDELKKKLSKFYSEA